MRVHQSYNRQTTITVRGHWHGKATVTSLRSLTESNISEASARRDVKVQTWRCRGTNMILDGWWYQGARIESYMFVEEKRREIHSTYSEFDIDPINQRRTWAILSVQSLTSLWYLYGWIWAIRHGGSVRYTFKSEVSRWRHVEAIDSSYR